MAKQRKTMPAAAVLRSLFRYDANTGMLISLKDNKPVTSAAVRVNGVSYHVPRVIWSVVHGFAPVGTVLHIDDDTENNRIENLTVGVSKARVSVIQRRK